MRVLRVRGSGSPIIRLVSTRVESASLASETFDDERVRTTTVYEGAVGYVVYVDGGVLTATFGVVETPGGVLVPLVDGAWVEATSQQGAKTRTILDRVTQRNVRTRVELQPTGVTAALESQLLRLGRGCQVDPQLGSIDYLGVPLSTLSRVRLDGIEYKAAFPCVLVGERTAITAAHVISPGTSYFFAGDEKFTVTSVQVPRFRDKATDLAVISFDKRVPGDVPRAKLARLPRQLGETMASLSVNPVQAGDATLPFGRKLGLSSVVGQSLAQIYLGPNVFVDERVRTVWTDGDSGSPVFALEDGEWKLAGCAHTATSIPSIPDLLEQISL